MYRRSGLGRASDVSVSSPATADYPFPLLAALGGGAASRNPNIVGANSGAGIVDTRTPQVVVSAPATAPYTVVTPVAVVATTPAGQGTMSTVPTSCPFGQDLEGAPLACTFNPGTLLSDIFGLPASLLYQVDPSFFAGDSMGFTAATVSAVGWAAVLFGAWAMFGRKGRR